MNDSFEDIVVMGVKTREQGAEVVEKLFAVTRPGAVYSKPVTAGDYMVITASEVSVGMGFGYGVDGGVTEPAQGPTGSADEPDAGEGASGLGSEGGGGGVSVGRAVATISIGPEGVRVEPVRDVTKIGLALFTTAGAMLMMLGKMRRASRF